MPRAGSFRSPACAGFPITIVMNRTFGLKQFRQDDLLSSLIYDRARKLVLLVDPQLAMLDDCRSYLIEHSLKLFAVLDTTQMAGPGSAAARVCEEHRCLLVRPGPDPVEIGSVQVRLFSTPFQAGPSGVCAEAGELLFTGFAPWEQLVLLPAIARLPDSSVLLPSEDARGVNFSTLAHERSRAERGDGSGLASIGVEKYANKIQEHSADHAFVDVREPEEYDAGHIPGVRNVPLAELPFHLDELKAFKRVYLSCLGGRRAQSAGKTLVYLGFPEVINVSGGYQAWTQAGLKVERK